MRQEVFLEEKIPKLYLKYLIPSISASLVTSVYILADTLMIGRGVGAVGIAALNILLPIYNIFYGSGMLCGVGGSVLFSVCRGRGEEERARDSFTCALALAAALSILYVTVFHLFFNPITAALGSSQGLRREVEEYGRLLVFGAPVFIFSSCLQAFVRNDRAPKLAMAGVMTGGVLNIVLDAVFIFPFQMGMRGAILATVISTTVTIVVLSAHFLSRDNGLKLSRRPALSGIRRVAANGFSSFLLEFSSGVVIFLFNRQLLHYVGENGVAAYGIVSNSAIVVSSVCNGIAQAVQPILAVNFGAGKKKRVEETRRLGLTTAMAAGLLFAAVGFLCPEWLIHAFVEPTEEILRLGVPAIRLYFLSFTAAGANILLTTYFQSVLKPAGALAVSMLRGLILNSFFVMILPAVMGVNGIWITMILTEFLMLAAALFMVYVRKPIKNL